MFTVEGDLRRLDTSRPFTRADALAAGIAPKHLRGSLFRRIFRGVYVDVGVRPTPRLRGEAALCLFSADAFLSHASAARVHGVPLPTLPDEHVSVRRADERRSRAGIVCHVATEARVVECGGLRSSCPAQMFVELASILGLVDLVVVGDNLVRTGRLSPEELVAFCSETRLPARFAAQRAAALVRRDVDSPMETRLRLLIVLAGLPEPEVNVVLRAHDGDVLRKYDLSYSESRVIVEYDGRHHVERVEQWESDLDRREAIDDDGWRILVCVAADIDRHPEKTLRRVHNLLKARRQPGLPQRLRDDWRPHFPGH